jgi:hypothetical protein
LLILLSDASIGYVQEYAFRVAATRLSKFSMWENTANRGNLREHFARVFRRYRIAAIFSICSGVANISDDCRSPSAFVAL